jgi:hypothetical protein
MVRRSAIKELHKNIAAINSQLRKFLFFFRKENPFNYLQYKVQFQLFIGLPPSQNLKRKIIILQFTIFGLHSYNKAPIIFGNVGYKNFGFYYL